MPDDPPIPDLSLVPIDALVDEIFRRCDAGVVSIVRWPAENKFTSSHRFHGPSYAGIGLATEAIDILREHLSENRNGPARAELTVSRCSRNRRCFPSMVKDEVIGSGECPCSQINYVANAA